MTSTDFTRQFQYDAWANGRTLEALERVGQIEERSRQIMAHLLTAQKVWLTRLEEQDSSHLTIWPEMSLADSRTLLSENQRGYEQFLAATSDQRLGEPLTYRNSKGVEFRTRIDDILTQVLFHGAYHRGQLALAIKRQGGTPPDTDYISFTRQT